MRSPQHLNVALDRRPAYRRFLHQHCRLLQGYAEWLPVGSPPALWAKPGYALTDGFAVLRQLRNPVGLGPAEVRFVPQTDIGPNRRYSLYLVLDHPEAAQDLP